ncbi:MAG: HD domain-containing phosphohydrolase [Dehalococcoidia bacterium]|jgi:response regulator RpfG family c-di-GMP phosphodiesterase
MNKKVLLVDDDRNILDGYRRVLRGSFDLVTCDSGAEGLDAITAYGPFAVVVSDYRMPGMNGVQFLSRVRQVAPDTVRIMLTGQADMQAAIDAINDGAIFRFLSKPCSTELFTRTLNDGAEQFRLITAERELLDKTLKGAIGLLADLLAVTNPVAFSKSSRMLALARRIASRLKMELWEIEIGAMLSQIGCITVPAAILEKKYRSESLSEEEMNSFLAHAQTGKYLLISIPRLEGIAEAIGYQFKQFDGGGIPKGNLGGKEIPVLARLLKVIFDYDELLQSGRTPERSLEILQSRQGYYDPDILATIESEILDLKEGYIIRSVSLQELAPGMILEENITDKRGLVLITRGHEITDVLKMRLMQFDNITEPIRMLVPVALHLPGGI